MTSNCFPKKKRAAFAHGCYALAAALVVVLLLAGHGVSSAPVPPNLRNFVERLDDIQTDKVMVAALPSGAPPTNDGFAYSQVGYTTNMLYIAGQNGYDSCGRLVPKDYDYATGRSHSLTRIAVSFLNVQAAVQCFHMSMTDIPGIIATVANTWNSTRLTAAESIQHMLSERSLVNFVQLYFWGSNNKMTREFIEASALSRGDTFEVLPMPIPRRNMNLPTCIDTHTVVPAAQTLLDWTLTGNPPAALDTFLYSLTGLRLGRGLGACSNPELRNDDWADTPRLSPAPKFGDAGDLLAAESTNPALAKTQCVVVPSRADAPAANLFVRTEGKFAKSQASSNDPVIVFIHGTSASHNYWRGVQRLMSRRYATVAIDLRGHGQSEVTPAVVPAPAGTFKYTYKAFSDDIAAVLQEMGLSDRRVVIAGISIGASIAVQFAVDYPSMVDRLVLVSGSPLFRCPVNGDFTCEPYIATTGFTPINMLPEDVLSGCNVSTVRDKIAQNRAVSSVAVTSLLEYAQKDNQTALLAHVRHPSLVISGSADASLTRDIAARALVEGLNNAALVRFINRGHLLITTSYVDVANQMTKFLHSNSLPSETVVFDNLTCQIPDEIAPEANFIPCPSAASVALTNDDE